MRPLAGAVGVVLLSSASAAPCSIPEWLSANELEQSCEAFLDAAGAADGNLCLAFLQGFLAGGRTTGSDMPAGTASQEQGSFLERATQTRLGAPRMRDMRGITEGDYCLDQDTQISEVVRMVTDHLTSQPEAVDLTDAWAVREALTRNFPCEG
jgi:hypothetical protein